MLLQVAAQDIGQLPYIDGRRSSRAEIREGGPLGSQGPAFAAVRLDAEAVEFTAADAPSFERYGKKFDPRTGNGGFEIWLPVKG